MCIYQRTIHSCNHYIWGSIALKPCNTSIAYSLSLTDTECDTMTSHSLKTLKVDTPCWRCVNKKRRSDVDFGNVKGEILRLRSVLRKYDFPKGEKEVGKGVRRKSEEEMGLGGIGIRAEVERETMSRSSIDTSPSASRRGSGFLQSVIEEEDDEAGLEELENF